MSSPDGKSLKDQFQQQFDAITWQGGLLVHADCFKWMEAVEENSFSAVVTDPPFSVKDFSDAQLDRHRSGQTGSWASPPSPDGKPRAPVPRFRQLGDRDKEQLHAFFQRWAELVCRALRPGGHVFLASNSSLSQRVYDALIDGGLEYRGEIIRLIRTLRGGDRPKCGDKEFPDVCTNPRGCFEPWGIFRNPLPPKMNGNECLRVWGTGALRRRPDNRPFLDVIASHRTPYDERKIAPHLTLKPQDLMRHLVYSVLPMGTGVVADPFMGAGSTIAACCALGISSVGVERDREFFEMAVAGVPRLAAKQVHPWTFDVLESYVIRPGERPLLVHTTEPLADFLSERREESRQISLADVLGEDGE